VIIGCYTPEGSAAGAGTGMVVPGGGPARATPSPSYLIVHNRTVFAVNEIDDGSVSSFKLNDLSPLSTVSTGGLWPCHLAYHPAGYVLAANYGSGSVSVHPVTEGVLGASTDLVTHSGSGPNSERQEGPHAHQVVVHPDETVTIVDLGIDRLMHYRLADGRLSPLGETVLPPGTGPRHMVLHRSGRWYVVGELSATVMSIVDGAVVESCPTTASPSGAQPSAIVSDGELLYVANRGTDTIAVLEVSPALRRIAEIPCGGEWPRDLALDGDRMYVANQYSHTVVCFTTGRDPQPTGEVLQVPSPACVLVGA
jgi:6-phosphogluconolactonase